MHMTAMLPSSSSRVARVAQSRLVLSAMFVVVCALVLQASSFWIYETALIAIYGIVGLSQEWMFGRAGQVTLGAAALLAVGAYTTAWASTVSWLPFPLPLVVAGLAGAVVGVLIGVPGLRFSGLYLLLTTLALQFIVSFAGEQIQGQSHASGFTVKAPAWGSVNLSTGRPFLMICMVVLGLTMLGLSGLYRTAPGRAWSAIRQNEVAAATLGIPVVRWKLVAFVGSSAVAAVAGSLYAYSLASVDYNSFSLDLSLTLLVMVFIGGVGWLVGPLVGAFFVALLPTWVGDLAGRFPAGGGAYSYLSSHESFIELGIYGLLLVLVLLYERGGIVGGLLRLFILGRRRWELVRK